MSELTTISAAELAELKDRLARLGREKAQLQLIALLMNRLSELPGLERTVEGMLQFVMDILGGLNVTIYYRLDDEFHCVDVHGRKEVVGEIDDDLVRQVFETRKFVSRERDFSQTGMMTNEFTKATTWVMPLLVGTELVGVLRMDDLLVAGGELRDEVRTFLRYASLVLKNEISGETRLRRAFDEVDRATRAEAALAAQHSTLRGIIEGTTSPIFSVDREYRYVAFNRSHASVMNSLFGVEIEVGRSFLDYMKLGEDREKAKENLDRALAGEHLVELVFSREDRRTRRCFEVSHHPVRNDDGEVIGVAVFADDITERKRAEVRLQKEAERGSLLLDIFIRSPQLSEKQVYDEVLELAVRFTDSTIGFLHRVSDDQKTVSLTTWNEAALESCAAVCDTHYSIEGAGNWVDCVRLGRPVICNDLAASPHQKGLPLGHAPLRRFMSVPVIEGDKVRIVFGVGNKAAEYVDDDVFQVQQIAGELQKVVRQRRAAERVESLGRLYRTISEMNQVIVREKNRDRLFAEVCRICVEHGKFAMAWAGLVDLSTGIVQPLASAGVEAGYVDELSVRLDVPPAELRPAARAVLADRAVVVDDTETDETFAPWREAARLRGFRSCAAFPVRAGGEVRGLLKVYAFEAGVFHGEVAALFAELGADLGYALHALETEELRTQAERALQRSRNSLEEAQRIAHIGNWDLDLESDVLGWSDEIYRIFEIDPALFGASYDAFLDTIHPEDRAFVDRAYTESVRTRSPYDIVHRLVMADGRVKYVNERCETFYAEDGRPLRSIGTVQDVTERKRAEDEVFEAQRVFRTLVESSPDIVARYDRDCRRTYVNPRYLEVAQIPHEALLGAAPVQRSPLPAASAAVLQNLLLKVLGSGIAEAVDVVWPKADGVDTWYNIYAFPELDREGRVESVMTVSRDITDRKRAEGALQRSEEKYRTLIQKIRAAVVVYDADSRVLTSNALAQELLGLTEDQMEGMTEENPAWSFVRADGSVMPPGEFPVAQVLRKRQALRNLVVGVHRPDEEDEVWVLANADPVHDEDGGITQVIVTLADITERKHAEQRLQEQLAELQRWHEVTLDREERVQVLKREVNELSARLGEPPRYASQI